MNFNFSINQYYIYLEKAFCNQNNFFQAVFDVQPPL